MKIDAVEGARGIVATSGAVAPRGGRGAEAGAAGPGRDGALRFSNRLGIVLDGTAAGRIT